MHKHTETVKRYLDEHKLSRVNPRRIETALEAALDRMVDYSEVIQVWLDLNGAPPGYQAVPESDKESIPEGEVIEPSVSEVHHDAATILGFALKKMGPVEHWFNLDRVKRHEIIMEMVGTLLPLPMGEEYEPPTPTASGDQPFVAGMVWAYALLTGKGS